MSNLSQSNHNQTELKVVEAKLEALDRIESKHSHGNSRIVSIVFGMILFVEVLSTCKIIHKYSRGNEIEKLLQAITASAFPIAFTLGSCYFVANQYGIKQQQESLSKQYKSLLDRS
jgi:hypothetical protein